MRLCRYRWDNVEKGLALKADISRPLVPVPLLRTLSQLKTVDEVYGSNQAFSCPFSQGVVDIVILRAATGPELTIVEVQRDGCRGVLITHADFATYIAYLGSAPLLAQLDAIKAAT